MADGPAEGKGPAQFFPGVPCRIGCGIESEEDGEEDDDFELTQYISELWRADV